MSIVICNFILGFGLGFISDTIQILSRARLFRNGESSQAFALFTYNQKTLLLPKHFLSFMKTILVYVIQSICE